MSRPELPGALLNERLSQELIHRKVAAVPEELSSVSSRHCRERPAHRLDQRGAGSRLGSLQNPLHLRERQLDGKGPASSGQVDELAREKKYRFESWMENGGDPEAFERAGPPCKWRSWRSDKRRLACTEDIWS